MFFRFSSTGKWDKFLFTAERKGVYGLSSENTNSDWNKIINLTMVTFVYGNYTN